MDIDNLIHKDIETRLFVRNGSKIVGERTGFVNSDLFADDQTK